MPLNLAEIRPYKISRVVDNRVPVAGPVACLIKESSAPNVPICAS
jgi:hypothetical protein